MAKKEIRPYLIFPQHPDTRVWRVFTSDDPGEKWKPGIEGQMELKADGKVVFAARHGDIFAIHDLKNELIHGVQFEKLGAKLGKASNLVGADGEALN